MALLVRLEYGASDARHGSEGEGEGEGKGESGDTA